MFPGWVRSPGTCALTRCGGCRQVVRGGARQGQPSELPISRAKIPEAGVVAWRGDPPSKLSWPLQAGTRWGHRHVVGCQCLGAMAAKSQLSSCRSWGCQQGRHRPVTHLPLPPTVFWHCQCSLGSGDKEMGKRDPESRELILAAGQTPSGFPLQQKVGTGSRESADRGEGVGTCRGGLGARGVVSEYSCPQPTA